jgi:crotonobetainyl-CoA:carnitine CoA-transferase CaiB-like acyl-CoA transferase
MTFVTSPLSRFTVLELGSTVAGPFCGRLLADFGAQVIKIEDPRSDTLRSMGESLHGKSLYAASILRNKSNIAVNLRSESGQAIVKRLANQSDVVIENFRPGALEKWGLGYDVLSQKNPGLVLVRISGFGQTGPYSQRPGYGVIGEAMSGLRSINGDPDRPPARMATALTDYITGLYAAFGALVALLEREKSGVGQVIDAALSECAFSLMEPHIPAYDKLGIVAERSGSRLPGAAPNNLYETADNQFIHIAAFGDSIFKRLCQAMDDPALCLDARFENAKSRASFADELDQVVSPWVRKYELRVLEGLLLEFGVPASRIFSISDIFADPHFAARSALTRVRDEDLGEVALASPFPLLSRTPGKILSTGRAAGVDTISILSSLGGFSASEIEGFVREGAVTVA